MRKSTNSLAGFFGDSSPRTMNSSEPDPKILALAQTNAVLPNKVAGGNSHSQAAMRQKF